MVGWEPKNRLTNTVSCSEKEVYMRDIEQTLIGLLSETEYKTRIGNAGVFRFPSNFRFETHAHEEYEINYINAGNCMMEIEGAYIPLKQGECIVIAPQKAHCFMVDMQKTCKITQLELIIHYPKEAVEGLLFPGFREDFHRLRDCEQLVPLIERICYYYRAGEREFTGKIQINLMLLQLYALLSEEIMAERLTAEREEADRVHTLIRYIDENLEEELNIEEMSLRFGISSRYVRKYFEQQMGVGCNEYIAMLRIGRAKRLLWNPEYSITEIALMCGFTSSQYFSRVFGKRVGVPPAEYRRQWRRHDWKENPGSLRGSSQK